MPSVHPFTDPMPDGSAPFPRISAVFLGDNKINDWCGGAPSSLCPPVAYMHTALQQGCEFLWHRARTASHARPHRARPRCASRRSSIDALNYFPGLVETRLTGNPCVEANRYSRYEIVARVRWAHALSLLPSSSRVISPLPLAEVGSGIAVCANTARTHLLSSSASDLSASARRFSPLNVLLLRAGR